MATTTGIDNDQQGFLLALFLFPGIKDGEHIFFVGSHTVFVAKFQQAITGISRPFTFVPVVNAVGLVAGVNPF